MADYIPRRDDEALDWFRVFKNGIASDWSRYGLGESDSVGISKVVDEFQQAYDAARNPLTRNVVTTGQKRLARRNAEGLCRLFAARIKGNRGVSNAAKDLIRVPVINNTKSQVWCPISSPMLSIVAATPMAHTVGYCDSLNSERRAKPFGATSLQLFVHVGPENVLDPTTARFLGNYTTTPIKVTFDGADRGLQATYFARWSGRRNQVGQFSLPISMTIAA